MWPHNPKLGGITALESYQSVQSILHKCICWCIVDIWRVGSLPLGPNEFAGSVVLCLMTSLTLMLHIVSQASGNRSAADVPTLPPGARSLARQTDGFGRGPPSNPLLLWHSLQDTSICSPLLWETISLAPIQSSPPRPHLHIFVIRCRFWGREKGREERQTEGWRVAPRHLGSVSSTATN